MLFLREGGAPRGQVARSALEELNFDLLSGVVPYE